MASQNPKFSKSFLFISWKASLPSVSADRFHERITGNIKLMVFKANPLRKITSDLGFHENNISGTKSIIFKNSSLPDNNLAKKETRHMGVAIGSEESTKLSPNKVSQIASLGFNPLQCQKEAINISNFKLEEILMLPFINIQKTRLVYQKWLHRCFLDSMKNSLQRYDIEKAKDYMNYNCKTTMLCIKNYLEIYKL
ncbi:hypothetical protein R6Q59_030552 [Mikania micrantha]